MTQVISSQRYYRTDEVFRVTCPLIGECSPICVLHWPGITRLSCQHCGDDLGTIQLILTTSISMGLFLENVESAHVVQIVPADIWLRENQT